MSLITDTTPINQPEGTYPFALNVINSTSREAVAAISSEPGFETIYELTPGKEVIGKIYFDNKILLFITDNTTDNIGVIENNEYRRIWTGNLNFNKDHKILGQHRNLRGCEDVFYFMDGVNPDRYFNLNDIPQTAEEFNILQTAGEPSIDITINNTGGRMPSGGFSAAIQYVNLQGDVFDQTEPTVNIPIYEDTISATAQGSTEITNKSATINLTNLDTRFPFIKLLAIHNIEGQYEAYEIETLYPTSNSVIIEYQGPTDNDIRIDNREVQVDRASYNTSLVAEQVQGRLLRANVQQLTEDFSEHQRLVNEIVVLPEIIQIPKSEFSQNPNNQIYTFQSDEVYGLGLRFKDSTLKRLPTPVYHIPGREALSGELDIINFNGESYQRFEIENTAEQLNRSIRGMGYYQTNNNYPTIVDQNNVPVYGDLAGTPIRHHKMPSRRTVQLENPVQDTLQGINIILDNVTIPTGYDSYELMYVQRTDNNSTVLDSGYAHKGRSFNGDYILQTQMYSPEGDFSNYTDDTEGGVNIFSLTSPESLLGITNKGNYVDITDEYIYDPVNGASFDLDLTGDLDEPNVALIPLTTSLSRTINSYTPYDTLALISSDSKDSRNFTETTINADLLNDVVATELDYNAQEYSLTYYINKRITSVHNNLDSLVYKPLIESDGIYQGDTFISKFYNLTVLTGNVGSRDTVSQLGFVIEDRYVESKINYDLLLGERFILNNDDEDYVASKVLEQRDDDYFIIQPNKEEYRLNNGYNYGSIKSYFPLPFTYDYSNLCRSSNPTRIIFSPQSFQEELSDSYLISNVNDYIDLPANTGEITGLKYKNNRLYVHTTQTTYVLFPNPQYLSTNQEVAQLQTGDFLSVPPQQIIQTDYGYGGLQSKTATINTEYGYFWLDGLRGSLNTIQDSFKSISNEGMIAWFKNNTTQNTKAVMGFDPYYNRLLLTVRNNDDCQPFHTLSYSLLKNSFTSFHSYNPDFYLMSSADIYSTYQNKIRLHSRDSNYNEKPVVIEQVDRKMVTSNLVSLNHYTEFFEDNQEVKDCFSNLIIYNSNQSSGLLNLFIGNSYSNLFHRPGNRPVAIQDKNHKIANIWDNSTSSVVTRDPCNENIYTDKRFVNTIQEGTHYNKPNFKEKYTIARLTYLPEEDRRMTHYLLQQNKQQSIR